MSLSVHPIPVMSDNYVWVLTDTKTGITAIVDPGVAEPVEKALDAANLKPDLILLTHHHPDHTDGTEALRKRYNAKVAGAANDASRLPKLDIALREGDTVAVGDSVAKVLDVPGHTIGHIAFYFDGAPPALFCGDTLFSMGCGRLFEGTPAQMCDSLSKFNSLPDETRVYCGHEYTLSNAAFAHHTNPDNKALQARIEEVKKLRAENLPTLPTTLGTERATNPFLLAKDVATFTKWRQEKDNF